MDKRLEEEIRVTRQFTRIISNNVKKIGALFKVQCTSGHSRWYHKSQLQTFYSHMVYDKCKQYKEPYTYNQDFVRDALDLISVLTGDDTRMTQFLLHWIYTTINIPSVKCERIPFISSAPGVGKDTLVSILESIMGAQHVWKCEDSNQIFENFNPMLESSYLVVLSEFDSHDMQRLGKMKHYAT
eukprot:6189616-Pleurochrysis_carterae.AAC.2